MTHHKIKVLEDGTRVYSNGTRYKPKAPEERVYRVRKPAQEGAVWWGGGWRLPLDLLPLEARLWPETRPDTDAYDHMIKPRRCKCWVCKRPEAKRWKNQWRREQRRLISGAPSGAGPLGRERQTALGTPPT
jgi:hypothetical protein